MPHSLGEWLAWMEASHPRQIELGLGRIGAVAARLALPRLADQVITVAGTNGKGSCVACLEAMLIATGQRVGCYTSPHLLHYNERIRIDGRTVADDELCRAFEAVHAALDGSTLTYFEFGTLAAFWLLARQPLDVVVLEVGLGGRLDAVNLIDADVAVVTAIDLDHQDWLGDDRESIGREKAGIFRAGRPAICVDPQPPRAVGETAAQLGARWLPVGEAFCFERGDEQWSWYGDGFDDAPCHRDLPLPALPLPSAAAALAALHAAGLALPESAIRTALAEVRLPGRFQRLQHAGIELIFDVAHNPHATRYLAQRLAALPPAPSAALLAVMADKDIDGMIAPLRERFSQWYAGDLPDNTRALPATQLVQRLAAHGIAAHAGTVTALLAQALRTLAPGSRLVIFGSFFTVAAALAMLEPAVEESVADEDAANEEAIDKKGRRG